MKNKKRSPVQVVSRSKPGNVGSNATPKNVRMRGGSKSARTSPTRDATSTVRVRSSREEAPRDLTPRLISARSFVSGAKSLKAQPLIVVSLPVWNTPKDLFERALRSILNQSYPHVVVLVSSDGESTPSFEGSSLLKDPRVVTHRTENNYGPYFHHHVAWASCPQADLFALQDSDDVSSPTRFARQLDGLRRFRADAAFCAVVEHRTNGRRAVAEPFPKPLTSALRHPLDHFWLVRRDFIQALGGYYLGTRVGADSLLTSLALKFGRCVATPTSEYHRYSRVDSLTQSKATGHASKMRAAAREKLQGLWGRTRPLKTASQVRAHLDASRSPMESLYIERAVERLAPKMEAAAVAALAMKPQSTPASASADSELQAALSHAKFSTWSITKGCAEALYADVARHRSRSIVDFGSGVSTLVFALHAKRTGAKVVSLEADEKWLRVTDKALRAAGLREHVTLLHAPLKDATRHRISRRTYQFEFAVGAPYDFVFIDGPPESVGRHGTLPSVALHMAPEWHGWLHDGARPGERECVALWTKYLPLKFSSRLSFAEDDRGVLKLSSR